MRTQAHRIVDTDPKRGNVVVRLTDPHTATDLAIRRRRYPGMIHRWW
jgi:hypothetical protein